MHRCDSGCERKGLRRPRAVSGLKSGGVAFAGDIFSGYFYDTTNIVIRITAAYLIGLATHKTFSPFAIVIGASVEAFAADREALMEVLMP